MIKHAEHCAWLVVNNASHFFCECDCHYLTDIVDRETQFSVIEDADISNPPDEVTWYPINDPNASWNQPK